ncbi:MAG: D-2-hydroxyacid dehydrogenase [Flavobacteriales bacterium]|nr:D-2-hydroxyacid dehydrogenase [Flavobacteriales bacterium]
MTRILANDGVTTGCKEALENAGFEVSTENVPQEKLNGELLNYDVILVRSATTVRKETIDACPNLKLIGRGGVGMDNIDVEYAKGKGIEVINTPAASSASVGELVFAHLFGMARFLPNSNRDMPLEGDTRFKDLKKKFAKGTELRGKTLGIIGIGRIGQATANIALGIGMKVIATDPLIEDVTIEVSVNGHVVPVDIKTIAFNKVLKESDYITIHIPGGDKPVIGKKEFNLMKDGVGIVNCARGGVINEMALIGALESGKLAYAGLDVFENEPTPAMQVLMNDKISLSPHIGAATLEAQDRIGMELAQKIITFFKN